MTTINSQEDFLRALSENPSGRTRCGSRYWVKNCCSCPYGSVPLRNGSMPLRNGSTPLKIGSRHSSPSSGEFNNEITSFVTEQREFNNQTDANFTRIDRRLDTLTVDVAVIKGYNARAETVRQAWDIALDLGLEYVRTLPSAELGQMAQAAAGSIPTNELRSFRRADLVIEATDASSNTHYIAAEISFTADRRTRPGPSGMPGC